MTIKARRIPGKTILLSCLLLLITVLATAQETSLERFPGLRDRAVVMQIVSRIVEQDGQMIWEEDNTRVTIGGRPVGLRLVGAELLVAVQFTPFLRPSGKHTLVAQGQIWINIPEEGISYHTTMQTISLGFGEEVYFFPLGSMQSKTGSHIEIQLMLEPYTGLTPGSGAPNSRPHSERRPSGSNTEGRQDTDPAAEDLSSENPENPETPPPR